jgi:hypothetical protein
MSEIETPLKPLTEGLAYIPGPDEYVITEAHSHADILRYVVSDIGVCDVRAILETLL